MAVLVDDSFIPWRGMKMCHMWADTRRELHEMADALGFKRSWFQDHPRHPHYDVSASKRAEAIRLGAVPVSWRDVEDVFVREKRRKARIQARRRLRAKAQDR